MEREQKKVFFNPKWLQLYFLIDLSTFFMRFNIYYCTRKYLNLQPSATPRARLHIQSYSPFIAQGMMTTLFFLSLCLSPLRQTYIFIRE